MLPYVVLHSTTSPNVRLKGSVEYGGGYWSQKSSIAIDKEGDFKGMVVTISTVASGSVVDIY